MSKQLDSGSKIFNAGYEITQRIDLGDRQFVVGHRPTAPSPYVTWEYFAERDSYYQGHYFSEASDATLDMFRRASEELSFDGKSLGMMLLSDEDRQNLYLEFSEENARQDIAYALSNELENQDQEYNQEALLADPDFISRAMHLYNKMDHSSENEVLQDEIAMLMADYPQYKLQERVPQQVTVKLFPEMNALISDLLSMPSAKVPEKYGPLGDNIAFEIPLENGYTATFELVPQYDLLNQNKLSETEPHYASIEVRDEEGNRIDAETIFEDLWEPDGCSDRDIVFEHAKITITLQEDQSLSRVGNSLRFHTTSEEEKYRNHNGEICKVQRPLTSQEYDILCTGFMWVAQFPNGDLMHVFDDELEVLTQEQSLKVPLTQQIQTAQDKADNSTAAQKTAEQER